MEVRKFEEWMLAHLKKFFPARSHAAGESRIREIIHSGIERAAAYEINSKRNVCKYIDLMVLFGRHFDTDKRFPWAKEILARTTPSVTKMRSLQEAAQRHLRQS